MPSDPPDSSSPPPGDKSPWEARPPGESAPPEFSFSRPRPRPLPRPLSGNRDDTETISRVERVPRPEPVARIGGARPSATSDEAPEPWPGRGEPAGRDMSAADPTSDAAEPPPVPTWPARESARPEPPRSPFEEFRRANPIIPRESTDEIRKATLSPRDPARDAPREVPPIVLPQPYREDRRSGDDRRAGPPREGSDERRSGDDRRQAARLDVGASRPMGAPPAMELPEQPRWQPREPRTWEEAGLDPSLGEQLVLRYFAGTGTESARTVANDLCLALPMTKELLEQLKTAKLLQHRGSTAMGDFIYELTEAGRSKALDYKRLCAYVGPAPVPWPQYLQSVRDQTLRSRTPTAEDLGRAFEDLLVSQDLVDRLGPAITSGRAMFLHGDPGNGKTSIAERITRCFGDEIWLPHALLIDGHLVKLYDPATHEAVDPAFKPLTPSERLDRRWVKIRRPTVVAGGELTLEMLEIQLNQDTNICEAPLQLKANCGTLVIDDFGRQRMEPQLLLNRWIFPLERRIDFLRLPDGRKISSPFDPLLIFSTNLEPHELVDEAFLRRIPYKIQVHDPTEEEFVALVELVAARYDVVLADEAVDHLVERHYKQTGRKLRFCHPRDLLMQIVNQCAYERRPRFATAADFDRAVQNYFGAL